MIKGKAATNEVHVFLEGISRALNSLADFLKLLMALLKATEKALLIVFGKA